MVIKFGVWMRIRHCSLFFASLLPSAASDKKRVIVKPTHSTSHTNAVAEKQHSVAESVDNLEEAQRKSRELAKSCQDCVEVVLLPGVHELEREIVFSTEDNGIHWRSADEEYTSTVSGGRRIYGWVKCDDAPHSHLMCAKVPAEIDPRLTQPRHLFINGRRVGRARAHANIVKLFAEPISVDDDKYVVKRVPGLKPWLTASKPNVGAIEFLYTGMGSPWTESRCTVERISLEKVQDSIAEVMHGHYDGSVMAELEDHAAVQVFMKQPCFKILQHKACKQSTNVPRHIENTGVHDLIPGQWFLHRDSDSSAAIIKYLPLLGEDVLSSTVVMPVLEQLVSSDSATPVSEVSFTGITWEHATWRRPNSGLGFVEQQSGALVSEPVADPKECIDDVWRPMPSNIVFQKSNSISFMDCTFRHLGAGALQFTKGAHASLVSGCYFYDVSGTSVQIGEYDTFAETDPSKQERNNTIMNCKIEDVGVEFHGAAGIQVGYSTGTKIANNEISHLTWTGISIGWGFDRVKDSYASDNLVLKNYIHDYKMKTPECMLRDGGGIYTSGPQQRSCMEGNWVSRASKGDGGGAYYPDRGSAYWVISHNVFSDASFCEDDCRWLHMWTSSVHDIEVHHCYTDTATAFKDGPDCSVEDITVVKDGQWPDAALEIMRAAGPTKEFRRPVELVFVEPLTAALLEEAPATAAAGTTSIVGFLGGCAVGLAFGICISSLFGLTQALSPSREAKPAMERSRSLIGIQLQERKVSS